MKSLGWERKQRRAQKGRPPIWCYVKGDGDRRLCVEDDPLSRGTIRARYADEPSEI